MVKGAHPISSSVEKIACGWGLTLTLAVAVPSHPNAFVPWNEMVWSTNSSVLFVQK